MRPACLAGRCSMNSTGKPLEFGFLTKLLPFDWTYAKEKFHNSRLYRSQRERVSIETHYIAMYPCTALWRGETIMSMEAEGMGG